MEKEEALLEAKNLRISFKTINGTVKAVRGINFSLYRGRTLGIVGESGSGKSVTSRAILGILAGNRIIEGGQILYDGMDLLSLSEEEFCKLRGRKISMIFQDPMSSLNPIMKVGEQLTETMFLKEKSTVAAAHRTIDKITKILKLSLSSEDKATYAATIDKLSRRSFDEVEFDRIQEARKAFIERIDLLLNTTLVNIFAFRINNLKKQLPEIEFMLNETLNKILKESLVEDKPLLFAEMKQIKELLKTNKVESEDLLSELQSHFNALKEMVVNEKEHASVKYTVDYNDEDQKFMFDLIHTAVSKEFNRWKEAEVAAIDYFKDLKSQIYLEDDGFNSEIFRKNIGLINSICMNAVYGLSERKDDIILTLPSTIKILYKDYKKALTRDLKNEKLQQKMASKSEKAIHDLEVKQRAFSSEVSVGAKSIVIRSRELIDTVIQHLEAKHQESFDIDQRSKDLYRYLYLQYKDTVKHVTKTSAKMRAINLLREVGIPEPEKRIKQYPFQFSGGMRQRIVIAIALSSNPEILICDEPTTALDVTIQSQILDLITKLKVEKNLSIIFITHDLGVIANMADDIAVMYAGKIVEYGTVDDIFYNPQHPYTWALLASMPDLNTKEKLDAIPGTPPNMILPPKGDAFAVRNKYALAIDYEKQPPMFKISDTHSAATWLLHPNAPHAVPPRVVLERIERAYKVMEANNNLHGAILENQYLKEVLAKEEKAPAKKPAAKKTTAKKSTSTAAKKAPAKKTPAKKVAKKGSDK